MTQKAIPRGIDAHSMVHPFNEIPLSHEQDEALTYTTAWKDLEDTVLSERSRHTRPHSVAPLIGNVQNRRVHRQEVDSWGAGDWGGHE
jgi:hypothetical protein